MIHIESRYVSKLEGTIVTRFKCRFCSFEGAAIVRSRGRGEESTTIFGSDADKEAARQKAWANLRQNAEAFVPGARCCQCSKYDEAVRAELRSTAMGASIFIAILLAILGAVAGRNIPVLALGVAVIGVVVAVVNFQMSSWKWLEIDSRVLVVSIERLESSMGEYGLELSELANAAKKATATAEVPSHNEATWRVAPAWRDLAEDIVRWPFYGTLHAALLMNDRGNLVWLTADDIDDAPLDHAHRTALDNLKSASALPLAEVAPGVFQGKWNDHLAASRLLLPLLVADLALEGSPVAFTPSEDTFVVAGADDAPALRRAFEWAIADCERVLHDRASPAGVFTATPWRLTDGKWVPWNMPLHHPLLPLTTEWSALQSTRQWKP